MINAYYKSTHRKSIKCKKIGWFTEWRLKRRGEKDCKNKIVRQGTDGKFSSPFLMQELCLCIVAIKNEKETLTKILMEIDADTAAAQFYTARRKEQINRIKETIPKSEEDDLVSTYYQTDIIKAYHEIELRARISAKMKQIDDLSQSLEKNEVRKSQNLKYIDSEIEITKLRCYQLYKLLEARLYSYWTGVLKANLPDDSISMPLSFEIDDLVNSIKTELNNFIEEVKIGGQE